MMGDGGWEQRRRCRRGVSPGGGGGVFDAARKPVSQVCLEAEMDEIDGERGVLGVFAEAWEPGS